jgi:hypothetical protein
MISYEYYTVLVDEATSLPTVEQFIGDMGYPMNMPENGENYVKMMNIIFAVSRNDLKKVIELSGKKLAQFTDAFRIPYGTARKWCTGERPITDYNIQMIGYIMISDIYAKEEFERY